MMPVIVLKTNDGETLDYIAMAAPLPDRCEWQGRVFKRLIDPADYYIEIEGGREWETLEIPRLPKMKWRKAKPSDMHNSIFDNIPFVEVKAMPWTAKDAKRHTSKAKSPTAKRQWAKVANSMLRGGSSEGAAVRAANAAVAKRKK
jgi:hypothetical protein